MRRMYSKPQLLEAVEEESKLNGIKVFEDIKDKDGHPRFIEGDIELLDDVPSGVTKKYGKWSLSGSHLLIVLSIDIASTTEIVSSVRLCTINLPKWIYDKLDPLFSSFLVNANFYAYASNGSNQSFSTSLRKYDLPAGIQILLDNNVTLTADRNLRMNYDLLIDNE